MSNNLQDKRILVTGAARGIGLSISRRLLVHKPNLVMSASKSESFKNLLTEFSTYNNLLIFPFDLRNSSDIKSAWSKIEASIGGLDILINNAGTGKFAPFLSLSEDDFDNMVGVNLKGLFTLTQLALKGMIERKSGIILNILSVASINSYNNSTIYGASKAAALSMSRTLRKEVREHGIKVIDILPGATETEIWSDENRAKFSERMMQPDDVATVVESTLLDAIGSRFIQEEILLRPQLGDL